MTLLHSPHFDRSYSKAPKAIQQAFDKQALLLLQNLRHPFTPEMSPTTARKVHW